MAKVKHPTSKTLRQGQTVYHVVDPTIWQGQDNNPDPVYVQPYFLYSHKTSLPENGCRVEKMPVNFLRRAFDRVGIRNKTVFYSKRLAQSLADRENKERTCQNY